MPLTKEQIQERHRACSQNYRMANREKIRASNLKWRTKNPNYGQEWYQKNREKAKIRGVKYLYGISPIEYEKLLKNPCMICGQPARDLDHCHTTGKIRGVLCRHCNLGLGHFRDDLNFLQKAIAYLQCTI